MSIRFLALALGCWGVAACDDSAFFGEQPEATKPAAPPPAMAKPAPRPPECQAAMELIAGCQVPLEPSRISAVAECKKETYLGDTELQVFLRCLGEGATCEQLAKCSGPIEAVGAAAPASGGQ
jgi:hypothetical protein